LVATTKHLVRFADKTPYVFSGSTTFGWDCSGMVVWTYKKIGISLPHSADKQAHIGKRVSKPRVGDIVVFAYSGSTDFYHSAIYLGNGKIINANRMYGTTKIQLLSDFHKSQIRFVRVIK
jgi:cell wall-associated NlpC family hydrolase